MLADATILKQLREVDTTKITKETASKAKDMLGDANGDQVKKVSLACYGIHEWNVGIIQAVLDGGES